VKAEATDKNICNNNNNNNNNNKYAKRSHFRNLPSHKEVYVPVTAIEI